MTNKEKENFLRRAILIVDHSKDALTSLVELDLANKNTSFEDFININQHEIYHLCYSSRCCQCLPGYTPPRQRILYPTQLELLLEKITKFPGHSSGSSNDYCCSKAISGLSTNILDLTLAKCLLINFSSDVFWHSCLKFTGNSFEDFLNQNKHTLYHLWQQNTTCCQCPQGYIFPTRYQQITTFEWNNIFSTVSLPCTSHRKRTHTGHTNCICTVSAVAGIQHSTLDPKLQRVILQHCCEVRQAVDSLASIRNNDYGHAKKGQITDVEYNKSVSDIEKHIINIARICKKETQFRHKIEEAKHGALDEKLLMHYRDNLLEFISRQNDLNESLSEIVPTLGGKIASKSEQIPDIMTTKMLKIIDESVQQMEYNLETRIKEGLLESNFLRQKDLTAAEIESHLEEGTFVETKAVRKCLKKAEMYDVFIINGTTGTGKSRIGLEILRQFGNKYKDFDLIKITNLKKVDTMLTVNRKFILLLDKVFCKTKCLGNDDNAIFHSLYIATRKGRIKLICTVPSYMKGKMEYIYQSQRLFQSFYEIDLNLPNFQMSNSEKETLLKHYCIRYNINIVDKKKVKNLKDDVILNEKVPIKLCTKIIKQIVDTEPFMGYPRTCYMFTSRRVYTRLGLWFFVHPTEYLVKDINELRDTGNLNEGNKLTYMTLCYLFLNENCLSKHSIDNKILSPITAKCYGSQALLPQFKLKQTAEEMVGIYLSYNEKNGTYSFQHPVVGEAVAISLNQVDPKLAIDVIDFNFIREIVRLEHYEETKQKATMKVPRQHYVNLICRLVTIFNSQFQHASFEFVSKLSDAELLRQNDNEFLLQLYDMFSNITRNETMEIKIQDKDETLVFFFPAVFLLYITKQSAVDKVVASLLNLLKDTMQSETDLSKVKACHIAFEFSFIYLCEHEDCSLKLELLSGLKDELKVECDISFCLETALKRGNIATAGHLILTQSKHFHIAEFVMTIDEAYLISAVEVLSDALNIPSMNHTTREHILKWVIENAWDKFNIDNVVKSACQRHLTGLLVCLIERCPNGLTDFSCNLIISESCEHEWKEVVSRMLGQKQFKQDQMNMIFLAACRNGWTSVLDWLQVHVDKRLLDIKTATDENFRRQQFEMVVRLLVDFVSDTMNITSVIVPAISKYGIQSFVEWLLLNVDKQLFTNRDKNDNDDIYLNLNILKCVLGLLQHLISDTTILDTINTYIRNKAGILQWLTGNVYTHDDEIRNIMYTSCKQGYVEIVHCLLDQVNHILFDINKVILHSVHQDTVMIFLPKVNREKIDFMHVLNMVLNKKWIGSRHDLVKYLLDFVNQEQWDLTKILLQLPDLNITDVKTLLLEKTNHSQLNSTLRRGFESDDLNLVKWLLNNVEHKTFDFDTAINDALLKTPLRFETILFVINHSIIDIKKVMSTACQRSQHCQTLVKWIVDNVDHQLLDFNTAIDNLLLSNLCDERKINLILHILQSVDHSLVDITKVMNTACKNVPNQGIPILPTLLRYMILVKWILENVDHKLLDFNTAIENLLSSAASKEQVTDLVLHILQHVELSSIDMKKIMNTACKQSAKHQSITFPSSAIRQLLAFPFDQSYRILVKWIVRNVDHKLLDFITAIDNLLSLDDILEPHVDIILHILQHVDNSLIDMRKIMNTTCNWPWCCQTLVKWIVENVDHKLLDFNTAIDNLLSSDAGNEQVQDLVLHILQNIELASIDMKKVMYTVCKKVTITWIPTYQLTLCFPKLVKWIVKNEDHKRLDFNIVIENLLSPGASNEQFTELVLHILQDIDNALIDIKNVLNTGCKRPCCQTLVKWIVMNCDHKLLDFNTAIENLLLSIGTKEQETDLVQHILQHVDHSLIDVKKIMNTACKQLTKCPSITFRFGKQPSSSYRKLVTWIVENIGHKMLDFNTAIDNLLSSDDILEPHVIDIILHILQHVDNSLIDMKKVTNTTCNRSRCCQTLVKWIVENIDHKLLDFNTAIDNLLLTSGTEEQVTDLVQHILQHVDHSLIDMKKIMNTTCKRSRWFQTLVKWIVENIDHKLLDFNTAIDNLYSSDDLLGYRCECDVDILLHKHIDNLLLPSGTEEHVSDLVQHILQHVDYSLIDMKKIMNTACKELTKCPSITFRFGKQPSSSYRKLVTWIVENIDHKMLDFNTSIDNLLSSDDILEPHVIDIILHILQHVDNSLINMKKVMNTTCNRSRCCQALVKWIVENADHKLFDFNTAIDNLLLSSGAEEQVTDLVQHIMQHVDNSLIDMEKVMNTTCNWSRWFQTLAEWIVDNVDHKLLDFNTAIDNLLLSSGTEEQVTDLVQHIIQHVDHSLIDMKKIMNTACKRSRWFQTLVKWIVENIDHKLLDFNTVIDNLYSPDDLLGPHMDLILHILQHVDNFLIDMKKVMNTTCNWSRCCQTLVKWIVDNVDHKLLDFNTAIDNLLLSSGTEEQKTDLVQHFMQHVDNSLIDMKKIMNTTCKQPCCFQTLVKWIVENVDHKLLDFNTAIENLLLSVYKCICDVTMIIKMDEPGFILRSGGEEHIIDLVHHILQHVDHSLIDMKKFMNAAFRVDQQHLVTWIVETVDHKMFDFNTAIDNLLSSDDILEPHVFDIILHILQHVDNSLIDMKKVMNTTCNQSLCCQTLVKWIVENVDHKLLDVNTAIDNLLSINTAIDNLLSSDDILEPHVIDLILHILQHVDNSLIDMKKVMNTTCNRSRCCQTLVKWIVENVDHKLLDFNTAIHNLLPTGYRFEIDFSKILHINNLLLSSRTEEHVSDLVQHILQRVDHSLIDMKKIMNIACKLVKKYWSSIVCLGHQLSLAYRKLVMWIVENVDHEILDFNTAIENLLSSTDEVEPEYDIILHILQHVDHSLIDCRKVMNSACERLDHTLVVLVLDNVDHGLLDVDTTVDTLFNSDCRKSAEALMLKVLQNIVTETNIKTILEKACHVGYSNVIYWVLQHTDIQLLDLKIVMNIVCYHGNLDVIEWLWNSTAQSQYDMRTAMNKACRGHNTLDTVMWLWHNVNHKDLDMKSSLCNACRHGNDKVVKWMLTNLPNCLFNMKLSLFNACEHGSAKTVKLLIFHIDKKLLDIQTALDKACKNIINGLSISKYLLSKKATHSVLDIYRIISTACEYQRTDIVRIVIERQDKSVDFRTILNYVVDMEVRSEVSDGQQKTRVEMKKKNLILWILQQTLPSLIDVDKVLVEVCTKGWMDVLMWIWKNIDHTLIDIKTGIYIACKHGRQEIVNWALRNIESNNMDLSTLMNESCGFGWIEEVKWLWQNVHHDIFEIQTSMNEACTYRRYEVVNWLITNVNWTKFNVNTVLIESCKNGWFNIVMVLLNKVDKELLDLKSGVISACVEGHINVIEFMFSTYGHDVFDLQQLEVNGYSSSKEVIKFLLEHYFNHKDFNLSVILMKASGHGWTDMVKDILENSNDRSFDWTAALTNACENGETDVVKMLINRIDPTEVNMKLAMIFVCRNGWEETVTLLLDQVHHSYLGVNDAMQEACRYGEQEIVELLFNKCSHSQFDMKTAVNIACKNQFNENLILWILERCKPSDIDVQNLKSKSSSQGWTKVLTFLRGLKLEESE